MPQSEFIKLINLKADMSDVDNKALILNLAIHYYLENDEINCVRVLSEIDDHLLPDDATNLSREMIYDRIKSLSDVAH